MDKIRSKKELAVRLSGLKGFDSAKVRDEQYITDSEIAADMLWNCDALRDVKGKMIVDLGAGTGILGIGAILMGAEKALMVEKDKEAVRAAEENLKKEKSEDKADIIIGDIAGIDVKGDVVIMNPPFGTKSEHADKKFLEKAFKIAEVVYSFHKSNTKGFIEAISEDYGFRITHEFRYKFPLKMSMRFHRKRIERVDVSCFRMVKKR